MEHERKTDTAGRSPIRAAAILAAEERWGEFREAWEALAPAGKERGFALGKALALVSGERARRMRSVGETREPPEMEGSGWLEEMGEALSDLDWVGSETVAENGLRMALSIAGASAAKSLSEKASQMSQGAKLLLDLAESGASPFDRLSRADWQNAIRKLSEACERPPESGWGERMAMALKDPEGADAIRDLIKGELGDSPARRSPREALKRALDLVSKGKEESLRVWLEWMKQRGIPLHRGIPQRGRPSDAVTDWRILWCYEDAGPRIMIRCKTLMGGALFAGKEGSIRALLDAGCPLPSPKAFTREASEIASQRPRSFLLGMHPRIKSGVSPDEVLASFDRSVERMKAKWEALRIEMELEKSSEGVPRTNSRRGGSAL